MDLGDYYADTMYVYGPSVPFSSCYFIIGTRFIYGEAAAVTTVCLYECRSRQQFTETCYAGDSVVFCVTLATRRVDWLLATVPLPRGPSRRQTKRRPPSLPT